MPNPLSTLWIGKATIYEYQDSTDENYQTTQKLVAVVNDEPCRISYNSEVTTDVNGGAPSVAQVPILFIRPDLEIKEGSVIEVVQHNVTNKYKRTSKPSIYTNHQEIKMELYEEHA